MKSTNLLMIILIAMTLSNCNNNDKSNKTDNSQSSSHTSDEISVAFLKAEHEAGNQFYLLDVRTLPEYNHGHLSFANDLIPYDSLPHYLDKIPQDKETTIYLFCRSGRRSGVATKYLRSLGYKKSYNVVGGIIAWNNAGFEIITGQ